MLVNVLLSIWLQGDMHAPTRAAEATSARVLDAEPKREQRNHDDHGREQDADEARAAMVETMPMPITGRAFPPPDEIAAPLRFLSRRRAGSGKIVCCLPALEMTEGEHQAHGLGSGLRQTLRPRECSNHCGRIVRALAMAPLRRHKTVSDSQQHKAIVVCKS